MPTPINVIKLTICIFNDISIINFNEFFYDKGGMKRRLSVANSLVGSPKIVYLDEPSTGLDPASRRTLWDCIINAKESNNKSIVLTTHSMEEADALCDRLAIMARGKLRCLGKAAELKLRFGSGFTFTVTINTSAMSGGDIQARQQEMHQYVMSMFPSASLLSEPIAGTSQYEINRKDVILSDVFTNMEDETVIQKYNITDWAITETTLDECFLKVRFNLLTVCIDC